MTATLSGISDEDIETFHADGVVHLKSVFDQAWLDQLRAGIRRDMADPGPRLVRHTPEDAPAHYWEDFWAWSRVPAFEDFLRRSPAPLVAADLLAARRINLVMDNWFYREAGSSGRPPWHHDIAYFDFEGSMCVLWLPLEAVSRANGIAFVRGSHLWNKLFMRVMFTGHVVGGDPGWIKGQHYEAPPDIDADPGAYDIVGFDLEAGDCIFFDMRCLHGALDTVTPDRDIARFTARFTAEDGCIRYRGDWAKSERAIFEAAGHREGDALDSDFFPRLWQAQANTKGH